MKFDMLAVIIAFCLFFLATMYVYANAKARVENYSIHAWVLAEQAADLLAAGESIRTNAFIRVTLILPNGTISRTYTIGNPIKLRLGYAYTFRILGNNTLMKVEVVINTPTAFVERG